MAYIARVSSPSQTNPTYEGLLVYCWKNAHYSVFEHGYITLEIETSRTVARQMLRHRSFTFSEFSQRYAEVQNDRVKVAARRQDDKNRQSSHDTLRPETKEWFAEKQDDIWSLSFMAYNDALRMGVAKECARALLPEGLTPSRLYMTGSVRSWLHYITLRSGNGTQSEHKEIARECALALAPLLPSLLKETGECRFSSISLVPPVKDK
jgi:thymidylate synthase (FAD)